MNKGERVGAILNSDKDTVYTCGYGVYAGPQIVPDSMRLYPGQENPKIELDNGYVVWGFQCYWGKEEAVKKLLEGKKVVVLDPEDYVL